MKTQTFQLTFVTPCFCAGANPAVAEIRSPSIRGKLRWWFRVLGGTPEQEAEIFGNAAGDQGTASALIVRTTDVEAQRQWQPINFAPNSNTGYLLYYAKASQNGARWNPRGAVPQGGRFKLQLMWRRALSDDAKRMFALALDVFLLIGALGLRSTRGLGCFETAEKPFTEEAFRSLLNAIKAEAPEFIAGFSEFRGTQAQLFEALGGQLRGLRKGCSAGPPRRSNLTPMGSSQPRQASAVHLRPVKLPSNEFRIVVFEAPASKVLGPESRRGAARLGAGVPPPAEAPQRGERRGGGWR